MSDIDPPRIDGSGRYKTEVPSHNQETKTQVVQDSVSMLSVALLYILAMVFPAANALPLSSDSALTPHEGKFRCFLDQFERQVMGFYFNLICKLFRNEDYSNRHIL